MSDCIFCRIINGHLPSTKVFENEKVYAFKDISPMAKVHYLFIHKEHTSHINDLADNKPEQLAEVFMAISELTKSQDLNKDGFRVVTNLGPNAGQTVFHTHFHVLAGEQLKGFGA